MKTFLGETGRFNGEDIIDIIVRQPATARFISRHMYSFFVADEPPVPQWPYVPPRNPDAIDTLVEAYFANDHNIGAMLRVLFNSDFFKSEESWYARVKSPAELVAGVLRLTGEFPEPGVNIYERIAQMSFMGQRLINPPTVEGWTQGRGWIDTGNMIERINFASERLGDDSQQGVRDIVDRVLAGAGVGLSPEALVDGCLDHMGAIFLSPETHSSLVEFATRDGELRVSGGPPDDGAFKRVAEMVRLVGATTEFQRA